MLPCLPRVPFEVSVGGRLVRGELNARSVRRTLTAVAAGQCTVIIQGRLDGDTLVDAGILGRICRAKSHQPCPYLPLVITVAIGSVGWLWDLRFVRRPGPSRRRSNWDEPPPDRCSARR